MIFKKKLNYDDLIKLILQTGYDRYIALNNSLKEEYSYNEIYFYLIWQNINFFIFQRMLKFQNILSNETDVFRDIHPLIFRNIISDDKDNMELAFINITLDLLEIWKNDNDTNSNNELNKTSNYLVNELLECDNDESTDLKLFFTQYLTDCHFENKEIINKFKIIIENNN